MAMNAADMKSLGLAVDRVYRDFCKVHPDNGSIEMVRSMLGATTAGIQAMPLNAAFRFDYLVRSGFDIRPHVDNRIRALGREIGAGRGDAIPLAADPAIRIVDFGDCLAGDGAVGELRSYFAHIGIRQAMMSTCLAEHSWRYVLFAARSPGQAPFDDRDIAVMNAMIPHFRSALRARTRLIVSERLAESCSSGLDRLGIGVVVINARGQMVEVSPVAERILSAKDGLVSSPRFGASTGSDNRRLQALLRRAASPDWEQGGVAMAVERPSGLPGYELLVDALPQPIGLPADGSVVIYLRDRMEGPAQALEAGLLQELFGLTEAEALVARAAADGRSSHEIASDLGIRYNTVRAHFRSIFAKSGFTNRVDLVHMVLNSPASLGHRVPDPAGEQHHARVA